MNYQDPIFPLDIIVEILSHCQYLEYKNLILTCKNYYGNEKTNYNNYCLKRISQFEDLSDLCAIAIIVDDIEMINAIFDSGKSCLPVHLTELMIRKSTREMYKLIISKTCVMSFDYNYHDKAFLKLIIEYDRDDIMKYVIQENKTPNIESILFLACQTNKIKVFKEMLKIKDISSEVLDPIITHILQNNLINMLGIMIENDKIKATTLIRPLLSNNREVTNCLLKYLY